MSIYKLNVPQILAALADAGSTGPSMDGNVIKLDGTVITMAPVPSAEELLVLNRLQPEVQRINNWLQDRITALQAENERLREALEALYDACPVEYNFHGEVVDPELDAALNAAKAALRREDKT